MNLDTYRTDVTSITYALEPLINGILKETSKAHDEQEVDTLSIEHMATSIKGLQYWLYDLAVESLKISPDDTNVSLDVTITIVTEKIRDHEPDSKPFNMAAFLLMDMDNHIGIQARGIFREVKNGHEFKQGLLEILTREKKRSV